MRAFTLTLCCLSWAAVLAFVSPAVCTAAESELGEAAGSVTVPAGLSRADVQEAIVKALLGRQWDVKSKSSDRVVGYIKHRSNEATLTLIYSDTRVDLFCVGWQIDKKTGAREKPEQPKGWLNYIRTDLAKILNRPAAKK